MIQAFEKETGFYRQIGQVIDTIDAPEFCPALTRWLNAVVPYSYTVVFGYHGEDKPVEIYDDFPKDRRYVFVDDYVVGPYLLDPFFLGAIRPVTPDLYRLRDLAPDRFYQGEYYRTYYVRTEIAEEIGYFAEVADDCHVVISLMRREKAFSAKEFRRLAALAPMVTALMRRHWAGLSREFESRAQRRPRLMGREIDRLTPREHEIVSFILRGHSAEATAQELGISSGTVRTHRRNIYAKLEIASQRELFARFLASLTVPPRDI